MRSRAEVVLLLGLVVACVAGVFVCGKSGTTRLAAGPGAVRGTYCETLASLPVATPRTPLPDDPVLARWVEQMESGMEEYLAFEAISEAHSRDRPPHGAERECLRRLSVALTKKLPRASLLRGLVISGAERLLDGGDLADQRAAKADVPNAPGDAGVWLDKLTSASSVDDWRSVDAFLGHLPDNARLRRGLLLHFRPWVEDNFSSVDGPLDRNELFLRLTVESMPERAGIDLELLVAADSTSRPAERSTLAWLRTAFGRTALDLGPTGNALRVIRDLARGRPALPALLLPVAKKNASSSLPPHRRARWAALVSYLEAGAPDPGEPLTPALVRAIEKDPASARWAMGFLPNELEEHAPRPYPYLRDPDLVRSMTKLTQSGLSDEDVILALDVVSRMPPGTVLPWIARHVGSTSDSVRAAAMSAIDRQIEQLPVDARDGENDGEGTSDFEHRRRAKNAAALLAPVLGDLRAALRARACIDFTALALLVLANDTELDAEVAACIKVRPPLDTGALGSLLGACSYHREYGWQQTADALGASNASGATSDYARRVENGCRNGEP